jgi:hypothetical protein
VCDLQNEEGDKRDNNDGNKVFTVPSAFLLELFQKSSKAVSKITMIMREGRSTEKRKMGQEAERERQQLLEEKT